MSSFQKQQKLLDKLENGFINKIVREKNRFIDEQANKLYSTRKISVDDYAKHKANMQDLFEWQYRRVIKDFSNFTELNIFKSHHYDLETKAETWELFFAQWLQSRGGRAAIQTSSTTRDDILGALLALLTSEEAVPEQTFIERILKTKMFSPFRARTIARTETHGAAMYASKNTAIKIASETGTELVKQWNSVEDDRTRIDHSIVNGQKRLMNQDFNVGGFKMDRPSDPRGGAGNVINCRCVMTYERRGSDRIS